MMPQLPRRRRRAQSVAVAAVLGVVTATTTACGTSDRAATPTGDAQRETFVVAAAANLRPSMPRLAALFTSRTGVNVTVTYGASSELAQQLEQGAPYAVFAAADTTSVDRVVRSGRGDRATRAIYAFGRLALWSPTRAYMLSDLASNRVQRVAIAKPDAAPYGRAAMQALAATQLTAAVTPKLVYAANVGAAQQLARSGNAEAAFTALALAKSDGGRFTIVPARLHAPIAQALVVTASRDQRRLAEQFAALMLSDDGRSVLNDDGYQLPDERDNETPDDRGA